MSADSPIWDVWEQIKSYWMGPTAHWDAEPPVMWAVVLNDLTPEQLGNGVRNFIHHKNDQGSNDFPPNPGQFKDLCLTNFDWERQCHKPFEMPPLIEDQGAKGRNNNAKKSFMDQMREQGLAK